MRTFQVYRHPTLGDNAVKVGFCWPAFFFPFFWMLLSRLWGWAGAWVGIMFVLGFLEVIMEDADSAAGLIFILIIYIAIWLIPGFQGNAWRAKNLLSRGFKLVYTGQAGSKDAAIADAHDST